MADDPRVQELLDEISDSGCTPEEVCGDCPELLPEVRRRWLQMRIVEAQLDALFPAAGPDAVAGRGSDGRPQGDPAMIGRYLIVRRLGQGGFGSVYLRATMISTDTWPSKSPARSASPAPTTSSNTCAEARALAQLEHPRIVPVHDVGRTEDGLCYVVSKYVEGSDLAERMRQGRLLVPRIGRARGGGRRGAAPCPHPRPGPPRHQAGQHPARSPGPAVGGRLRAGAGGRGLRQGRRIAGTPGVHEPRAGPGRRRTGSTAARTSSAWASSSTSS